MQGDDPTPPPNGKLFSAADMPADSAQRMRARGSRRLLTSAQVRERRKRLIAKGYDPEDRELYPYGHHSTPELLTAIMDFSDQTRAVFHAARSERNVHPVGMLLMELVNAGMRAPVDLGPFSNVPLNSFVALIGRAGTGKGQTGDVAAYSPWINPPMYPREGVDFAPFVLDETHELGSGQVLVDLLMEEKEYEDGSKAWKMRDHAAVHLHEDEFSAFLARMGGANATICQTVVSAWSGKAVGTASRNAGSKRRTNGRYALYFTGGLQPNKSSDFFGSADVGLPQRFIFSAVGDPDRILQETRIADPGEVLLPELRIPQGVHTFTLCPSIYDALDDSETDSAVDELEDEADALDSHALMVRIRIACLFALWHGSLEVDDSIWEWSEALMEHSRRSRTYCQVSGQRAVERELSESETAKAVARNVGVETVKGEVDKYAAKMIEKVALGGPCTPYDLRSVISGKKQKQLGGKSPREVYAQAAFERATRDPRLVFADGRFSYV